MEIWAKKANKHAASKLGFISTETAAARASIGLPPWIVIPVVVGSSPISHPKIYCASLSAGAFVFVAGCFYIQPFISTMEILAAKTTLFPPLLCGRKRGL